MGDEDRQPPPQPGQPAGTGGPTDDKAGSQEAGLHEEAGSAINMPGWADSLSAPAGEEPARRSRLSIDLARRLQEEEAARIARRRAEEEARRRAAAEAARRAKEEAARRKAAEEAAHRQARAKRPRKVSKWPSILAALAVILLGAFVGQRLVGGGADAPSQPAPTAFPVVSEAPAATQAPAAPPQAATQVDDQDTYTVEPGDTLESIAQRFDRSPEDISEANGAYGGLIRVRPGQVINIP